MERESVRADPGVPGVVVAVVEHLASQAVVGVISRVLSHAVELGVGQKQAQSVRLLNFLLFLRNLSFAPLLHTFQHKKPE